MAWHPAPASAMDLLPPAVNRLIALGCLAGIAAYYPGLRWAIIAANSAKRSKVVLPSARLTLLQILIGVVDLGFCACAMYLLSPCNRTSFHFAGGGVHSGDPAGVATTRRAASARSTPRRWSHLLNSAGSNRWPHWRPHPPIHDPVRHRDFHHGPANFTSTWCGPGRSAASNDSCKLKESSRRRIIPPRCRNRAGATPETARKR